MINSCDSKLQFYELMQGIINQHMKHVVFKDINAPVQYYIINVLLGDNYCNKTPVKRHTFMKGRFGNI